MPTASYKNRVLDARPDSLDLRDREYRPPLRSLSPRWPSEQHIELLLPAYTQAGMILNQGREGACTGFGLAAVINYLIWRDAIDIEQGNFTAPDNIKAQRVSPRMLYNMARLYDEWDGEDYQGSSCRGAMKGWHRHGVCSETSWPYTANNDTVPDGKWPEEATRQPLGVYYRINKNSVIDMQAAILDVGAIYCSCGVHEGWWLKTEKKLPLIGQTTKKIGGHAFAVVGYTADGFIVQNSWGEKWGFHGFAVLTYADWVKNATDAWVAVRGAPINKTAPLTFSSQSLQSLTTEENQPSASTIQKALRYAYRHPEVRPWDEQTAYQHTLLIANDGRPRITLVSASSPDDSARIICHDYLEQWLAKSRENRRIVVYAHGGLNNEQASIDRIRVMAPYFKANGIYPLFITWKTGLLESIGNQLADYVKGDFTQAGLNVDSMRAQGIWDWMRDAIDRGIEKFSRRILVRGIWSEMKENALYASDRAVRGYPQQGRVRPGGMVILSKALQDLSADHELEIHLLGHSAGAILLGHWLDELVKRKLPVNSATLYAPACSIEFANRHYINAHNKGILDKQNLHIHLMDDERELADDVAKIYDKSLLYLVSRALEDIHKMPLLGMAAAWDTGHARTEDGKFNTVQLREIKKWLDFDQGRINRHVYSKADAKVLTSLNNDVIDLSHGSFDNDIEILEDTLKRISNTSELTFPVENLGGF